MNIYLQIILYVTLSTPALPITALAQDLMINRGSNTSDPDTIRTEWFFTFITLILWLYRKHFFTLLAFLQHAQLPVEQLGGLHHVLQLWHVYLWGGASLDSSSSGSEVIFSCMISRTFKVFTVAGMLRLLNAARWDWKLKYCNYEMKVQVEMYYPSWWLAGKSRYVSSMESEILSEVYSAI